MSINQVDPTSKASSYLILEQNIPQKYTLKGGGNMQVCCVAEKSDQTPTMAKKASGLNTSQQQRNIFLNNIESQLQNLKKSSQNLKNQNNKIIYCQSTNWLNANQLVTFDILVTLKGGDIDTIQLFEDGILTLMDCIQNTLKKSKNLYLAFVVANQTCVMASSLFRFYLLHPMNNSKQLRIQRIKKLLHEVLESMLTYLYAPGESNTNYLEQCIRMIECFGLALPEQKLTPILNFASGFAQIIAARGTRGWNDMIMVVKEGVSSLVKNRVNQDQVDNFAMYLTLERVKFSIFQTLLDKDIDDTLIKEDEITQILHNIGKTIEYSQNWRQKYLFVQLLGELILFRPQIELESLSSILREKQFPFDLSEHQIWDILVKNNWVIQFLFGKEGQFDKIGYLNQNRSDLEILNSVIKKKMGGTPQRDNKELNKTPGDKNSPIKYEFIKKLNTILDEFEPIKTNLRQFILKGNQYFKGMLNYCFEGLDESYAINPQETPDDPLEILEISIKQIVNFACDFFGQQFTSISRVAESQLRKLFVASIRNHSKGIAKVVHSHKMTFESIISTHPSLTAYPNLIDKFSQFMTQFIEKVINYVTIINDSIKLIYEVTNSLQENAGVSKLVDKYIGNETNGESDEVVQLLISMIQSTDNLLDKIRKQYATEITDDLINKYREIQENIQVLYLKLSLMANFFQLETRQLHIPQSIKKLKILIKKLTYLDEKNSAILNTREEIKQIFLSEKLFTDQRLFLQQINLFIEVLKQKIYENVNSLKQKMGVGQEQDQEGQFFYYIKMINFLLIKHMQSYDITYKDLQNMTKEGICASVTSNEWIKTFDNSLKDYLKLNPRCSIESIMEQLEGQALMIEAGYEDVFSNEFQNCCQNISDNFNVLLSQTNEIFTNLDQLKDQQKYVSPADIPQSMIAALDCVKQFNLEQVRGGLLDDMQILLKDFSNSPFMQDLKTALGSLGATIDDGELILALKNKYSDQNWRIRDRIVIILFDLNRIYQGDEGEQIYANTLIHIKAKEINPMVQLTLKNEELLMEMKSIIQTNWQSQESEIKNYMVSAFEILQGLVRQMKGDIDREVLQKLLKNYEKKENRFNQQIDNITDIASLGGLIILQLEFLKNIKKQLFKLQQQVEDIKEQLKIVKQLSVYQLFEERRKRITQEEILKRFSEVHIRLRGTQYRGGSKSSDSSYEFIDDQSSDLFDYNIKIQQINFQEVENCEESVMETEGSAEKKKDFLEVEVVDTTSVNLLEKILTPKKPDISSQKVRRTPIRGSGLVSGNVKKEQKKTKYILNTFATPEFNSLLIHGMPGSGKSRLCQEIEFSFWQNRKVQKRLILKKLRTTSKLQETLKNLTINQIHEIMRSFNFINEESHFSDYFIEIQSELEVVKSANRVKDEEEKFEEGVSNLETESVNQYFRKKLAKILQKNDFLLVRGIYELLDDQFQNKPFPIYAQLGKLADLNAGNLLGDVLSTQYGFAVPQIQQIRELASQGDLNIVFILDGYNEMKQLQGSNLFSTNDLELLRPSGDLNFEYPKVIITCRTSHLSGDNDYSKSFQNIFKRNQRVSQQADKHYMEFYLEDLNQSQISQYCKAKFLVSLQTICLTNFEQNFQKKIKQPDSTQIHKEFTVLWEVINQRVHYEQEYDKIYLRGEFIDFIVENFQKNTPLADQHQLENFRSSLSKVYTQRMYEKMVSKTNIEYLLTNPRMMCSFVEAIEKQMIHLIQNEQIKQRIKSALEQDNLLRGTSLTVEGIISLLEDIFNNFSFNWERDEITQKINQSITKDSTIASNKELGQNLTQLIVLAMYHQKVTRYSLYEIFLSYFIKGQIKDLKDSGQLLLTPPVFLKECKEFVQKLAATFYENNLNEVIILGQDVNQNSIWDEFFSDAQGVRTIRQCLPLVCSVSLPHVSQATQYHFMHLSIRDFILAQEFYEQIKGIQLDTQFYKSLQDYKDIKGSFGTKTQLLVDQTYLDQIMSKPQELEYFLQFYNKKCNQKLNISELKEKIINIFQDTFKVIGQQLNKNPNLYSFRNKGIMDFLMDKMQVYTSKNLFVSNLNHLIQLGRLDRRYTNAAVNAIGLLIVKGQSFNHINFSGLELKGANLYGGQFYKCIFNNCNMMGINIATSIFYKCKFENSNLTNSTLHNCNIGKSKFSSGTILNDIQLCRKLDIYYNEMMLDQPDIPPFLHMIVDPSDSNYLIVIHTQSAIRISIIEENNIQIIKKFENSLSKCGVIKYKKKANCYLVGVDNTYRRNTIQILDVVTMNFIDQITLTNIDQITCFQYNNITEDVLVGGINKKTLKQQIYIGQFLKDGSGSTKLLTDMCDQFEMDQVKQLLICYQDTKDSKTSSHLCFNLTNYQQIGEKQTLTKDQKQKKYGDLKKMINMQKNRYLIHPTMPNIILSLQKVVKGIHKIDVQKEEEMDTKVANDDCTYSIKKKKKIITLDSIRTDIVDSKTYGRAEQILVNPSFPNLIICAYTNGLIRRFQMQSSENKNFDLFQDQLQINQMQWVLQNSNSEVLISCVNDCYDGIVSIAKFKFLMDKDQLQTFQIIQIHDLKTRRKKIYSKNESTIKHKIIGMLNHKKLLQEFILIVLENKNELIKFILNHDLEQPSDECIRTKLTDLTPSGQIFQDFSIHPEDHNIFCLRFDQDSSQQAQIVIYNTLQQQQVSIVVFNQLGDAYTRLYFDQHTDFKQILSFNRFGQLVVLKDISYKYEQQDTDSSFKTVKYVEQIRPSQQPPNLLEINPQQGGRLTTVIGKHPKISNILVTYDYIDNTLSQYNLKTGQIKTVCLGLEQKTDQIQLKKVTKYINKINEFHNKVINDILEMNVKKNIEDLLQDVQEEILMKQFDSRIQIKVNQLHPLVFIVYKEHSHMIYYSLEKSQVIKCMFLPFYFDPIAKFNFINTGDSSMILTYSQTIKVIKYDDSNEKILPVYQKNFSGAVFMCENATFEDCVMRGETLNMLKQNKAKILNK